MKNDISPEQVLAELEYDPDTGLFRRKHIRRNATTEWHPGWVNDEGYFYIRVYGISFKAHRLAWACHYREWPSGIIDHIDQNPGNNKISNLRNASFAENSWNFKMHSNNTSGSTGVYWIKRRQRWSARIYKNNQEIHLGYFVNKVDAAAARRAGELHHYGAFAPQPGAQP